MAEVEFDLGATEAEVVELMNYLTHAVNQYAKGKGELRNMVVVLALGALAGTMNKDLREEFERGGIPDDERHGLDTMEPFLLAGMKFGETGVETAVMN